MYYYSLQIKMGFKTNKQYKYRNLALQVGGFSRTGTIKYGLEPVRLIPERDCAGEGQQQQ
jgi:hypothetical protein